MAKPSSTTMLASSALCFLSLLRFAHCQDEATAAGAATASGDGRLQVEGMVYCDSCHVQKITTISGRDDGRYIRIYAYIKRDCHFIAVCFYFLRTCELHLN